jgi:hypothetical protein
MINSIFALAEAENVGSFTCRDLPAFHNKKKTEQKKIRGQINFKVALVAALLAHIPNCSDDQ